MKKVKQIPIIQEDIKVTDEIYKSIGGPRNDVDQIVARYRIRIEEEFVKIINERFDEAAKNIQEILMCAKS